MKNACNEITLAATDLGSPFVPGIRKRSPQRKGK